VLAKKRMMTFLKIEAGVYIEEGTAAGKGKGKVTKTGIDVETAMATAAYAAGGKNSRVDMRDSVIDPAWRTRQWDLDGTPISRAGSADTALFK
jgi:hypothetical protein